MAHGKHPLDVFRSTGSGFDHASRQRRTVSGKVISSSARAGGEGQRASSASEDDAPPAVPKPSTPTRRRLVSLSPPKVPKPAKSKAKPAPKSSAKPSSPRALKAAEEQEQARSEPRRGMRPLLRAKPFTLNAKVLNTLFSVALVVLAGTGVWLVAKMDWSGSGVPLKTADASSVLEPGPGAGATPAAADTWHTVRVATYNYTDAGVEAAWAARDELNARGYPVFDPVAIEQMGEDGVVRTTQCQLLVGQAGDPDQLEALRDALKAISDWPTGDPVPFRKPEIAMLPASMVP